MFGRILTQTARPLARTLVIPLPATRLTRAFPVGARLLSQAAAPAVSQGVVRLVYEAEEPKLVVPLPKKGISVFPLRNNRPLGSLLLELQEEDPAVKETELLDEHGRRVSKSSVVSDALRPGSTFIVNGEQHPVIVPTLAERLHEKNEELAALLAEQTALEELKAQSDKKANRHANSLVWLGFGGLCAQWGLMMRLTWFDYSWDVMEPIAYFLSFGTGILGYFFYIVTRQDYTYEALSGLTTTRRQRKEYAKAGLDVHRYRVLSESIAQLQSDIERIKLEYKHK